MVLGTVVKKEIGSNACYSAEFWYQFMATMSVHMHAYRHKKENKDRFASNHFGWELKL